MGVVSMFATPLIKAAAGLAILVAGALATAHSVSAQSSLFDKIEGKAFEGRGYTSERKLTYDQCQAKCLGDAKCLAFEFYKGGGVISRSTKCQLFSEIRPTKVSEKYVLGVRRRVADKKAAPRPSIARRYEAPRSAPSPVGGGRGDVAATERARSVTPPARAVVPPPATRGIAAAPQPTTDVGTRSINPPVPVNAERYQRVPVFYGTDRKRSDAARKGDRITYGSDRARKLQLGYAMVTVPLVHAMSNIERPSAWSLPYFGTVWQAKEDPSKHFTILSIGEMSRRQLLAKVSERLGASRTFRKQALVFIHGYNVGFDDLLYRTAQISYDLQFDGAAFTYSWPSGSGWTSYPYDRESAAQAEPYLEDFLKMVQNETGAESINIIAHSMGNQMLLRVLRQLKPGNGQPPRINQIVLAAPDVDRDSFLALASRIQGVARGITLYAASNDLALEASRVFAGNQPRAGDVPNPPLGPVVVSGIDTIDITKVSTAYIALNHSGYADHSQLLTDLSLLFRTGERPPNLRIPNYRSVSGAEGTYWRYGN